MTNQPLHRQFKALTICLVAIPGLLIMAIYTLGQISIAKEQNAELLGQRIAFQKEILSHWLEDQKEDVRALSRSEAVNSMSLPRIDNELHNVLQDDGIFASLSFIDNKGVVQLSTTKTAVKTSLAGEPNFVAASQGKENISPVSFSPSSGQPVVFLSAPVFDNAGRWQGMIQGEVRMADLQAFLRARWPGKTGEIILVDRQGAILTIPHKTDRGRVDEKSRIPEELLRQIGPGRSGTAMWTDNKGHNVLSAYLDVPERGWTIIGKIDVTEVMQPVYRLVFIMAVGTLALVLALLPLASLLTSRIKRPIEWLIKQSNLIAAEKYEDVGIEQIHSPMPRELTVLCDTFIAMSQKIAKTIGQLRENEAELANKINEVQIVNQAMEQVIEKRREAQEALQAMNADLENIVSQRMMELQAINRSMKAEIEQRLITEEALRKSHDDGISRENVLKHYTAELARANKELQAFATIIAHDFRSPMVNLKGFSQELSTSLATLDDILEHAAESLPKGIREKVAYLMNSDIPDSLGFIYSSVDRLDRMVNALLVLARQGRREMKLEIIDVNQLAGHILRSYHRQIADSGIIVDVEPLPAIMSDYLAIEQILANLLDNAVKYLDTGRRGKIKITCIDDGEEDLFCIKDNGRGIAAEDMEKIFEVFRRAGKQDVPGEGMGLAYVRALVRQLGGRVWCESQLDVGTKIYFTVPKQK